MKKSILAIQRLTVFVMVLSLCSPIFAFGVGPESNAKPLTEDQKILHVLNRLGFGARPGDLEKVKAIGLQKYIDRQMNPSAIDDTVADAKVKNIEAFNLSTSELFAKYPNPGALLRMLDGKGKGKNQNQAAANQNANQELTDKDRQDRQQKLREYYQKYDLRPAATLLPQIATNRILRDVYSERQLQEVMVDFWQNHFNVYAGKAAVRWYIPSYERDVLRPNALGNFKDLLVGTASHPAMLFYLDNFESVSPNAPMPDGGGNGQRLQQLMQNGQLTPQMRDRIKQRTGATDAQLDQRLKQMKDNPQQAKQRQKRGINENYARELMELHTLGVDGGYTQADIIEVAKCFTGWTIADPRGYRRAAAAEIKGTEDRRIGRLQQQQGIPGNVDSGEFYFNQRWHESGVKNVLGQKIDEGGMKDGLKVLDILVNSPVTAKFIARKLAIKFVSDKPSDGLVSRVADAFHQSGGDIKTTLRALFSDKEFFAPENYRAKIKTPYELAVSSIRAIGADTTGGPQMLAMLTKLGEVPYGYQAPTGYPDMAEDWVNTGALLERMNYAIALSSNQIPGTRVDLKNLEGKDKAVMLDKTIGMVLNNEISAGSRATLLKQIEQPLPAVKAPSQVDDMDTTMSDMGPGKQQQQGGRGGARQARLLPPSGNPDVFKVVSLVLGTPEFQRQ